MKILINSCWLALAALHIMPAAAFFAPDLVSRLYAVDPAGDFENRTSVTRRASLSETD